MKTLFVGIVIMALTATACNNATKNKTMNDSSQTAGASVKQEDAQKPEAKIDGSMQEMISQYMQIKNALANDNAYDAAAAGSLLVAAIGKVDKTSFTPNNKKTWNDVSDDAKEMAEHISTNAGKIEHQREHFDMLSKDMYDMVKAFGAGQTLYQDFCPMYNNKKGATWLSELKEIQNPYMGKKMATCGEVKEEIR